MTTTSVAPTKGPPLTDQVSAGVANAAAKDVKQAVAVIDRTTGELVASNGGNTAFNSESITKLFTAARTLIDADGEPDAALADSLRLLIQQSNNEVQSDLWRLSTIPFIAERYDLTGTRNSAKESPNTWGSDRITANDEATFLYAASIDPLVGRNLMTWMAGTEPVGDDGFNQEFGFNALTGDHGSKQGWSDPGWEPANLHSVGWTDRYFAAVLQSSYTASYATMRSTSNMTVNLIAAASP